MNGWIEKWMGQQWDGWIEASVFTAIFQKQDQLVAYRLVTGEAPGSNPGKGENFSVKINN